MTEASPPDPNDPDIETPDITNDATVDRPPRLLRRSRDDQVIAGVCAGLARYVGLDPVVIRVAFVLLAIPGGAGILLYLILAAVIPKERPGEPVGGERTPRVRTLTRIVGWAVLVTGGVLLVGRLVPGFDQLIWPIGLLALGAAILVQAGRD